MPRGETLRSVLCAGLATIVIGCAAAPAVEQSVAGTETLALHVEGMT